MRWWPFAFSLLAACSAAEGGSRPVPSNEDAGAAETGPSPASPSTEDPTSDAGSAPHPVRFKIQIDYRFDKAGFFLAPERKQALEGACRIWGRLLSDSYPNVPKGTFVLLRDPEKPTEPAQSFDIDYEIDDLAIFVGSADLAGSAVGLSSPTAGLSGVTDEKLRGELSERFNGASFEPWTAWISFDSKTSYYFDPEPDAKIPSAVPAGQIDFASVALHEIGHVLGFGTAPIFKSSVQAGAFTGDKTQAAYGGPFPLAADEVHAPKGTTFAGQRMLMDPSDAPGTRARPTPLDLAVLEDLGHTL